MPRLLLVLVVIGSAFSPRFAVGEQAVWRRWAILCSEELRETGIEDLLAVELSNLPDVELVERTEIAKVTQEVQLARCFGDSNVGERLKVGKILLADALVLVQRRGSHEKSSVQLVVAECHQGARLCQQEIPFDPMPEMVKSMTGAVVATRERFPRGVASLVGVSNFLSRNLTHEYDSFQTRYAALLSASLLLEPGIAVLEIEEARAIAREMPKDLDKRHVPVIVEADYIMTGGGKEEPPAVSLVATLVRADGRERFQSPDLPLGEVPRWLATTLANRVLQREEDRQSLDVQTQYRQLADRADAFARLGALDQSIPIREAILLLKPDLAEQRWTLIEECTVFLERPAHLATGEAYFRSPVMREILAPYINKHLLVLEHAEYLIRNKQIDREKALDVVRRHLASPRLLLSVPDRTMDLGGGRSYRIGQEELAKTQKPTRRFVMEVVPLITLLPSEHANPASHHDRDFVRDWAAGLIAAAKRRMDVNYLIPNDLRDMLRVYTELVPDGMPMTLVLCPDRKRHSPRYEATAEDYRELYRAMSNSRHQTAALLGRHGLLEMEWRFRNPNATVSDSELMEAEQLVVDYQAMKRHQHAPPPQNDDSLKAIRKLHREIVESRQADNPFADPGEISLSEHGRFDEQIGRSTGAVRFKPIPLRLKRRDGTFAGHPLGAGSADLLSSSRVKIVPCGPRIDVFWSLSMIARMRQPGILEELLHSEAPLSGVVFDGQQLWVWQGDRKLSCMDLNGKVVRVFDKDDGLPPIDRSEFSKVGRLALHASKPGEVFAVGSFGNPPRAWAAKISSSSAEEDGVRVFFEAKGDYPGQRTGKPVDAGFRVERNHAYQPRDSKERTALIVWRDEDTPLQINLQTLEVSLFHHPYEYFHLSVVGHSCDGAFLTTSGRFLAPAGKPWPDGAYAKSIAVLNAPAPNPRYDDLRDKEDVIVMRGGSKGMMVEIGDGDFLFADRFWYRINAKDATCHLLSSTPMTSPFHECRNIAYSYHHGVIGWVRGSLFEITIDESTLPPAGKPMAK